MGLSPKINLFFMVFLAICSLSGCKKQTSSKTRQIIGADDRSVLEDVILKKSIGAFGYRVRNRMIFNCTAFAISKQEIMTADHCMLNSLNKTERDQPSKIM